MRGTWVVGALVGVAAMFVCVGVAMGAAKPQTIPLIEVSTAFTPMGGLDASFRSPPKPGQGFVIGSNFYKWHGTKRGALYGTLQATCTFTKVVGNTAWEFCSAGALLPGGSIAVAGVVKQSDLFRIPIVGGTGVYTGARGYVRVKSIGDNISADTIVITG
jgi:hypothetical protein